MSRTPPCTGCSNTVAVILVAAGHVLAAQHRLGHRDAATTLRHYGWVLPPDDTAIADELEVILTRGLGAETPECRGLCDGDAVSSAAVL